MPGYLHDLARFASGIEGGAVPPDVRKRAAIVLADCAGCMVAGAGTAEVAALIAYCEANRRAGEATIPGTARQLAPADAAWVGGTAGTWHDLDEGNLHTRAHAAIQIVPALLAESEATGKSGRELLDALIAAYEVAGRLWRATAAKLAVHPHGTYGPLAAAVGLSRLRGERPEQVLQAMNIAMTLGTAASRQALGDGATIRNIYTGHSGRAGFEALALRDLGFSGEKDAPASILGNIYGDAFDRAQASAGLGDVWWIRKCYFKRFASGRYTHAALDALEELAGRMGPALTADAIARIDVSTYFMAATMAHQNVDTAFGLRFSIPALMAARIARGPAHLLDDGGQAFRDARVHALAARVFVTEVASMTAAYPDEQPAAVRIELRDGRIETVTVRRALGESNAPLPEGALKDKFIALAAEALGAENAGQAFDDLSAIDECGDVRALMASMRAMANTKEKLP